MRFRVVHQAVSYLLVLTSSLTLVTSGALSPLISAALLLAWGVSWFSGREGARAHGPWWGRAWNLFTLGTLAWAVLAGIQGGALLPTGAGFISLLMINKLFNRSTLRDLQQLYVLSFLQMVAATALNNGLVFGAAFLAYVVLSTWTLMLFHLKQEMEDNFLLKYDKGNEAGRPVQVERVLNSRKLVSRRFLGITGLVSVVVLAGSLAVFFMFPRVGFGLFSQHGRQGVQMTGFSDRIELGDFGRIKDDPTVVMRVHFHPPETRGILPLYWRGTSFETYDGRLWQKSRGGAEISPTLGGGLLRMPWSHGDEGDWLKQEIYLEPMQHKVLFGLHELQAVALEPGAAAAGQGVGVDFRGDVHYRQPSAMAFRYEAYTANPASTRDMTTPLDRYRGILSHPQARRFSQRYLQLPPELDRRVFELARQMVGDAETLRGAVTRVQRALQTRYGYTLTLSRDATVAPLEDFLFVQRKGHCEYFATAMVILLRTQGIAARTVNGFQGGTWNDVGEYLAVRQGDAHSWVEVWNPQGPRGRWVMVDPTPTVERSADAAEGPGTFAKHLDALRLRWYKWIIDYDLASQIEALTALADALKSAFSPLEEASDWRPGAGTMWGVGVGVLLLLTGWGWSRRRPPQRGAPRARRAASKACADLYSRLERVYASIGLPRPPTATAREYLALLTERGAPGVEVAREIISLYEGVRFGGQTPSPETQQRLGAALSTLKRTIKKSHRAQGAPS